MSPAPPLFSVPVDSFVFFEPNPVGSRRVFGLSRFFQLTPPPPSSRLPFRREKYNFGTKIRALLLTTIPDSTSQKFLLLGSTSRKDAGSQDRHVVVFLDFATMLTRQCGKDDFEKWYARPEGRECLMGHKVSNKLQRTEEGWGGREERGTDRS